MIIIFLFFRVYYYLSAFYIKKPMSTKMSESTSQAGRCCFRQCVENPSTRGIMCGASRVEVRAFEPKSKRQLSAVDWQEGGVAMFHGACWDVLVSATKGTNSTTQLMLSDVERSMILEAKKTAEFHDSDAQVAREARHIVDILRHSKHCIGFTGAGISTAAGIGDFRGKDGKWTEREKEKNYGAVKGKNSRGFTLENLRPTYTHEALVKLMELDILKFLISQNTDGLHRLSGIPTEKISELHGNSFVERCENCEARYERTFGCRRNVGAFPPKKCPKCNISHRTGRKCTNAGCGSYLMNTIINFGDYLETDVLDTAQTQARRADSVLVLGSTLRVSPANDLVTMGQEPNRLVICNRQTTPYDRECVERGPQGERLGSRVFGDCDRLMREVMRQLLPPEELRAWEGGRDERMAEYGLRRTSVRDLS